MNHSWSHLYVNFFPFSVILTPRKKKKEHKGTALNCESTRGDPVLFVFFSSLLLGCMVQKGLCQVQQRGGHAINLNKAFIPRVTESDMNG